MLGLTKSGKIPTIHMAYKYWPIEEKYLHAAEHQEPTASAMSGALAGLAVLEETGKKRKAEELTELTTSDAGGAVLS